MNNQVPKPKVTELVKDKFDSVLEEEYHVETAIKLFNVSIEVIRQQ